MTTFRNINIKLLLFWSRKSSGKKGKKQTWAFELLWSIEKSTHTDCIVIVKFHFIKERNRYNTLKEKHGNNINP